MARARDRGQRCADNLEGSWPQAASAPNLLDGAITGRCVDRRRGHQLMESEH